MLAFLGGITKGLDNIVCEFNGENNKLIIKQGVQVSNLLVQFPSDNGLIIIESNVKLRGRIRAGYNSLVIIGKGTTSTTSVQLFSAEQTCIVVGDDCMFAHDVMIRSEDGHAIYDVEDGSRINISQNVFIGAHTWIAEGATILSGARIGAGSVIGSHSIVTGKIPNNCVAVGSPARVVKESVAWERLNIAFSEPWVRHNAFEQNQKRNNFWNATDYNGDIDFGTSVQNIISHDFHYLQYIDFFNKITEIRSFNDC